MTEHMRGTLGQPFVIENVSGAGGSIGVGRVARAAPNGYTIGIGDVGTQVLNGAVYPLTYDVMTDFEPVALLVASPLLVLSRASLPAKKLNELVAWLKANQDKVVAGLHRLRHALASVRPLSAADRSRAQWTFVPYRGAAPAIQDLVGGQVDSCASRRAAARCRWRAAARCAPTPSCRRRGCPRRRRSRPPTKPACRASICRSGRRSGCRRARRRTSSRSSTPRWSRRWRIPACAPSSPSSGRSFPPREQQTPRGARGVAPCRSRQVVADHQGRRHQAGLDAQRRQLRA